MPNHDRAVWAMAIAACLALLLAPAFWNGFPLLQYDTGGYLARPFEGYLVPSRPAAYGFVLAVASRLDFWPAILAQAVATIWIVALVLRVHGYGARPYVLLGVIAILSVITTLSLIAAILLTDIFAGLGVLALHLLMFKGEALSLRERAALVAFAGFCAATHSATIALLVALVVLALVAAPFCRGCVPAAGLRRGALTAVLGVLMTLVANFAVSGRPAWTPGGYGIVFGRLLQDGIVTRYLEDHCPNPRIRLCPYRHELPDSADAFLWGGSVFNALGRFDGLNEEMRGIVLGSLREYPWLHIKTAFAAAAKQLVSVASGEGVLDVIWHTYAIIDRYTPSASQAMRAARQQRGELRFEIVNMLHIPVALLSIALLPAFIILAVRRRHFGDLDWLAMTTWLSLLANAAVCGVLSNPHDRYGARLAWIATLAVMLILPRRLTRQAGTSEGALAAGAASG